jgi:hypothetical protein
MCFDFLYNFCLKHLSFWEEMREIWSKMFIGLHVKYPLFLSDLNETWISSTKVRKILNYKSLWKFIQCGPSCSMRTDGRTDTRKLIVAFHNFAKARKMLFYCQPRYRNWLFLSFFFLVFSHWVLRFFDTTAIIFVLFLHHDKDSSLKRQTDPSKDTCLWFLLFFLQNSFRSTLDVTNQYSPHCVWIACHSFYSLRNSVSSFLWNRF